MKLPQLTKDSADDNELLAEIITFNQLEEGQLFVIGDKMESLGMVDSSKRKSCGGGKWGHETLFVWIKDVLEEGNGMMGTSTEVILHSDSLMGIPEEERKEVNVLDVDQEGIIVFFDEEMGEPRDDLVVGEVIRKEIQRLLGDGDEVFAELVKAMGNEFVLKVHGTEIA
eukprot:TRINITY_DN2249_c2_g1_i1.p1 TRINITY_DN2249_c2_g1~~TRINITY_DN2249_c2_g1_i1.p1  ORF type:complete len:169 (-),score=68.69 TRINITY_DN2249_c2_g1_i1:145-651(-)